MSAEWEIGPATAAAQLAATLARADQGEGRASVRQYTTTRPASIAAPHSDTPQSIIALAKPCATIVDGVLTLHPQDAAGTLVMHAGIPRWADLVAADGTVLVRGRVTDMDHGGAFRVEGAVTPAGEDSPMFYAGGLVQLGVTALV